MKTNCKNWILATLLSAVFSYSQAATYTVSNTNDSGIGSLRQAITNANANPGADIIQFLILDIVGNYFEGTTGSRFAVIRLQTALPVITDAVTIDGSTQLNTNTGTISGKTVGVTGTTQANIPLPDVYIVPNDVAPVYSFPANTTGYTGNGITINAVNVTINNIAISGFGNTDVTSQSAATSHSDISIVKVAAARNVNTQIFNCIISASPTGTYPSITTRRSKGAGILICGNNNAGTIRNNYIAYCGIYGIVFNGVINNSNGVTANVLPTRNWLIYDNQVISPTMRTATFTAVGAAGDGISMMNCYRMNVYNNWVENCEQFAIDQGHNTDSNYVNNNTITGTTITGGTAPVGGCRISFSSRADTLTNNLIYNNSASNFLGGIYIDEQVTTVTGATAYNNANCYLYKNKIHTNTGSGICVSITGTGTATGMKFSENLMYNNTGLGIDLGYNGTILVTPNDNADADNGADNPNNLQNFPVIDSVKKTPSTIIIYGKAPAGAELEFFFTDAGTNQHGGKLYNYGEASAFIGRGTEGSGADLRTTTGLSYNVDGNIASANVNGFAFSFPLTNLPAGNPFVTATATVANNTSEFGLMLGTAILLDNEVTAFTGKKRNQTAELNWAVNDNNNIAFFELEQSANGSLFKRVAVVNYTSNQSAQQFVHSINNNYSGANYYRLKTIYKDGSAVYSNTIQLIFAGIQAAFKAGPNPFTNKIKIDFLQTSINRKQYLVQLIDLNGQVAASKSFVCSQGLNNLILDTDKLQANSIYILKISTEDGEYYQQKLLHQ